MFKVEWSRTLMSTIRENNSNEHWVRCGMSRKNGSRENPLKKLSSEKREEIKH